MKNSHRGLMVTALILATAAAHGQDGGIEQAQALLKPFKLGLQEALRTGLQDGPVAAIAACRIQAPAIAESLSKRGIRLGRTSHRLRNPANIAPTWVAPTLDRYVQGAALDPELVKLDDGLMGYIEPITLKPLCTTCHGEVLAAPVAQRIHELYPQDRATGFKPGDFRGVFWLEFPAADERAGAH